MFAVVFIPDFSLQSALRGEPELMARAVALADPALPKADLRQVTAAARSAGVSEGMTASQAMARCPELIIKSRSEAQEQAAADVLLQTAYAFSPHIEATAPGVCTIELKGLGLTDETSALQWAALLRETLARFYLDARIGLGPTPALALLAARAADPILAFQRGAGHKTLDPGLGSLPVAALEPSPEFLVILERWGIRTVGALLALDRNPLADRLGPAALEWFDRVSPDSIRPLKLAAPPEIFAEQMEFQNEIETLEPLLFVLRRFVEQLVQRIELSYQVIQELQLQLGLSSGATHRRLFEISSPTANQETLFRILQTHLETVRTDATIVSLRLSARPGRAESHQFGLFETTLRDPNRFAETLARLAALCGPDRVGTPVIPSTHRPDAFQMRAPQFGGALSVAQAARLPRQHSPDGQDKLFSSPTSSSQAAGMTALRCGLALRRFRPVVAAHVEFREQRPALLRSSIFNGAIADVRGPFFSSGDWWSASRWSREEWDVQTSGGASYRIFRAPDGWFVEGAYD